MSEAGDGPQTVLFACTMNAVRSPMAAAILAHLGGHKYKVASAGVRAGQQDPYAIAVMDEIGIDLSEHEPCVLADLGDATFGLIITLSPEAHHHALEMTRTMAAKVEHWPTLDVTIYTEQGDRAGVLTHYRQVRDQLFQRIKSRFLSETKSPTV